MGLEKIMVAGGSNTILTSPITNVASIVQFFDKNLMIPFDLPIFTKLTPIVPFNATKFCFWSDMTVKDEFVPHSIRFSSPSINAVITSSVEFAIYFQLESSELITITFEPLTPVPDFLIRSAP